MFGRFLQQGYGYLGHPQSLYYRGRSLGSQGRFVNYRLVYDTGAALKLSVAITPEGRIDGLDFRIE